MSGQLKIIYPGGHTSTQIWAGKSQPPLKMLQDAVEGYIERVKVRFEGRVRDAYVNEDGISKGFQVNPQACRLVSGTIFEGSTIVGPLAIWIPDAKAKPVDRSN